MACQDELVWAAAWLFRATRDSQYVQYLVANDADLQGTTQVATEFSWDLKFAGAHLLLASVGAPAQPGLLRQPWLNANLSQGIEDWPQCCCWH